MEQMYPQHNSVGESENRHPMLKDNLSRTACAILLIAMAAALVVFNRYAAYTQLAMPLWVSAAFEFVLILFPCLLVVLLCQSTLPRKKLGFKRTVLVTGMGITGYWLTSIISIFWILVTSALLGQDAAASQEMINVFADYPLWALLFIIALTPAICEEFFFRGILMKTLSQSPAAAICISSALFAMMHFDVTKLIPTFAIGLFIGWVVMRTGNLASGMVLHFINNAFSVVLLKLMSNLETALGAVDLTSEAAVEYALETAPLALQNQVVFSTLGILLLFVLSIPLFILCLSLFVRDTRGDAQAFHRETIALPAQHSPLGNTLLILCAIAMFAVNIFPLLPL